MLNQKRENYLFYCLLGILFFYFSYVEYTAGAPFDGGDGITHYIISRFSWKHPELFLDLWGKPLFTLISSPFSQFGQVGINMFQVICALSTSWFCYRIAQKLNLDFAWLIPIFVCFSPIYFAVINSGLTEPFFGCLLMFSIWMIFEKKYIVAALVASLLPFIRSEAYAVLPLIGLVLLFHKQFISVLLLSAGTIIYGVIGYFYYGDALWLIHQNQSLFGNNYPGAGKLELFHYVKHYHEFMGKPIGILVLCGFIAALVFLYRVFFTKVKPPFFIENVILVYGSFFACFVLHTLLAWHPDLLNNLGMMRYMVTLIPSAALIALQGLNLIFSFPFKKSYLRDALISSVFCVLIIYSAVDRWYYPFRADAEQVVIKATGEWMNRTFPNRPKICYMHPYLPLVSDIDPYNEKDATLFWGLDKNKLSALPDSTLFIWDSHYAPQEGKLPIDLLTSDTNLIPLKHFQYYQDLLLFETWVFMKVSTRQNSAAELISTELITKSGPLNNLTLIDSKMYDFDSTKPKDQSMLSSENFVSGKASLKYTAENEFGPVFSKKIEELKLPLKMIEINFKFFPCDSIKDMIPVLEIKDGNKVIFWYGETIPRPVIYNSWNSCEIKKILSLTQASDCTFSFYFWNKGKNKFYVDDISFRYHTSSLK